MAMLPSLLFRQILILALISGACAVRVPLAAVAALCLLLFLPRHGTGRRLLLAAVFLLGAGIVWLAQPEAPDRPSWLQIRRSILFEGRVASATGLPGGRVRVLLEGLHPVEPAEDMPEKEAAAVDKALKASVPTFRTDGRKGWRGGGEFQSEDAPLEGLAVLTLDAQALELCGRPVPGAVLRALGRIYPSGGNANPGVSGIEGYWHDRDVWYSIQLVRDRRGPVSVRLENGTGWAWRAALFREGLRRELVSFLEHLGEGGEGKALPLGEPSPSYGGWRTKVPDCSQGMAMAAALLFGDRSCLAPETVDLFTRAGLIHSLALSGQHLALAAMAGSLSIALLSLFVSGLYRRTPRRVSMACAGLPFALAYLFLGGAPSSLIRAALMTAAGAAFLCLRRPVAPLDALFAAVLMLFLFWPLGVFDISVQLSVLAVAGIMLAMPLVLAFQRRLQPVRGLGLGARGRVGNGFRRILRWAGAMLLISLAAQAAVLPILASCFGAASPCFWLNMLWLPPLAFITLPLDALGLLLLSLFGAQPLSALCFMAAAWPADAMLDFLCWLDRAELLPFLQCFRPSALSGLGYACVLAALAFLSQSRGLAQKAAASRKLLAAGLCAMLAGQAPVWMDDMLAARQGRVSLTLLDVGHGQAALLSYPGGRVLIDGGGSSSPFYDPGKSIVAPVLTAGRMPRLDAVIVSHTDMDHARGLRWILEHFSVGALYWSPVSAARADGGEGKALRDIARRRGIPERLLQRGDVLDMGGVRLEAVWPDMALLDEGKVSGNDASLALRVVKDGHPLALLCGDMTSPALRRLLKSGQGLRADVLVLPHHGAASSFLPQFYDAVQPKAALASAASFSHYDFPNRRVRAELEKRGVPLASTTEEGAVGAVWTKDGAGSFRMVFPAR